MKIVSWGLPPPPLGQMAMPARIIMQEGTWRTNMISPGRTPAIRERESFRQDRFIAQSQYVKPRRLSKEDLLRSRWEAVERERQRSSAQELPELLPPWSIQEPWITPGPYPDIAPPRSHFALPSLATHRLVEARERLGIRGIFM